MSEPRDPDKRKPEPRRRLTKEQKERIAQVELDQQLLSVDERACVHLSMEYNREHAAIVLGWTVEEVEATLNTPQARYYLLKCDEAFLREIAKSKMRRMVKVGITKATVEQRLMELAQLDPSDTRGNIDGQVKALRTLAETLGMMNQDDPLKDKSREELEGYITQTAARLLPTLPVDKPPVN